VDSEETRNLAGFLWLLLPLALLGAFANGAAPAGLVVGFLCFVVSPFLGGVIMLAKGRSVRAGLLAGLAPVIGHLGLLGLESHRRRLSAPPPSAGGTAGPRLPTAPAGTPSRQTPIGESEPPATLAADPGKAPSIVPAQLDPSRPLPRWEPAPGVERDLERIDVLIEQLRRCWKRQPQQRLGQLFCNVVGPKPNPLFYVEDHVVSEKLLDHEASQAWPRVHAAPPRWLLEGEAPPADARARLRAIAAEIEREGAVLSHHVAALMDMALGTSYTRTRP
jgi:hypothetical protein